jgi:hypothetical protein
MWAMTLFMQAAVAALAVACVGASADGPKYKVEMYVGNDRGSSFDLADLNDLGSGGRHRHWPHNRSGWATHPHNGDVIVKASEITLPGLYWCSREYDTDDGVQGKRHEVVRVYSDMRRDGSLRMERLGWDAIIDRLQLETFLDGADFIGPFQFPGEGPKFEGFAAALDALCRAHGVALVAGHGDRLEVVNADDVQDAESLAALVDCTKRPSCT